MAEFYGVAISRIRHEITDEVVVDYFDKVTGNRYQQGGVIIARDATEAEIIAAIAKRCSELEAEQDRDLPPNNSRPVFLPSSLINKAIDNKSNSVAVSIDGDIARRVE